MAKHWSKLEDFERVLNFMYALEGGYSGKPMTAFRQITGWPTERVRAAFAKCVNDEFHMEDQFPTLRSVKASLNNEG